MLEERLRLSQEAWHDVGGMIRLNWREMPLWRPDRVARAKQLQSRGISAIEIKAPQHGGVSYGGLDVLDHRAVDPKGGTEEDLADDIAFWQSEGFLVALFLNLGYVNPDSTCFAKALRGEAELDWFLHSDIISPEDPKGDEFFLVRPSLPNYDSKKSEQWTQFGSRFFWTRWKGSDAAGNPCRFPQHNWKSAHWRSEALSILERWSSFGANGFILDAPNWHVGLDWQGFKALVSTCQSHGAWFVQPEGGGGFADDPQAWIDLGKATCIQDYALGTWWESSQPLRDAILSGSWVQISDILSCTLDLATSSGALTYACPPCFDDLRMSELARAFLAATGHLTVFGADGQKEPPVTIGPDSYWRKRRSMPGPLAFSSGRRTLQSEDPSLLLMVRGCDSGTPSLFAFSASSQHKTFFLPSEAAERGHPRSIDLPPYGFAEITF